MSDDSMSGDLCEHLISMNTFPIHLREMERVFRIKIGDNIGTCFTVVVDYKQYIITCSHVVKSLNGLGGSVELQNIKGSVNLDVKVIGEGQGDVDVAVLACDILLSCPSKDDSKLLMEEEGGMLYGQHVYYLGFPLGLKSMFSETESLPFIKQSIVSCIGANGGLIWLDTYNVSGFSGGPVYYYNVKARSICIGSIIAGYRHYPQPVFKKNSSEKTDFVVRSNSNLAYAYSIHFAYDIIKSCPEGFSIS